MNRVDMRNRLRKDLKDEDSANYRWTDAELDRHIDRTVRELSLALPLEAKATLTTTAGSRELSISSLTDLVAIEAVEYPTGKFPVNYVLFSLWQSTLTLLTPQAPQAAEGVAAYYTKLHTLNDTTSSLPSFAEELVATGAAGYAALEWANYAINRVAVGGEETWRNYLAWGEQRLASFMRGLARYAKNRVRAKRLYRPYEPKPSQTTDWGP